MFIRIRFDGRQDDDASSLLHFRDIEKHAKARTKTNNDDRVFESEIWGAARTTTRAAHASPAAMVVDATRGAETRARKRKRDLDAQGCVAFPALPFHLAVSLVEKHLPDPADLAVLRSVSKGMRSAVDATGRKIEEFKEEDAAERGYLSTLKCLRRRGRLSDERLLCAAAARNGCLLYTSPSPRDRQKSRMPSSA